MYDQNLTKPKRWLKERRSQRIDLSVSVVVQRPQREGPQFCESTKTLVVSAHGALVALKGMVAPKQKLLLQNTVSGERQECRVVCVNHEPTGQRPHRTSGVSRFRLPTGLPGATFQKVSRHAGFGVVFRTQRGGQS